MTTKQRELLAPYFQNEEIDSLDKIFSLFQAEDYDTAEQIMKGCGVYDKFLQFCKDYILQYKGDISLATPNQIMGYMFTPYIIHLPKEETKFYYKTRAERITLDGFTNDVLIMPIFAKSLILRTFYTPHYTGRFEIPNFQDCDAPIKIISLVEAMNHLPNNVVDAEIVCGRAKDAPLSINEGIKFLPKSLKSLHIKCTSKWDSALPSITHLKKLEHLFIDNVQDFLYIHGRKLPKNIQKVTLCYRDVHYMKTLSKVATTVLKACPQIAEFVIQSVEDEYENSWAYRENMRLFEDYGFQYNEPTKSYFRNQ